MPLPRPLFSHRSVARRAVTWWLLWLAAAVATQSPAAELKTAFDLPAGPAERALKRFSLQSGVDVIFVPEAVASVVTKEVKGNYTSAEAIRELLDGTALTAEPDPKTGALRIVRTSDPNAVRAAQPSSDRPAPSEEAKPAVHAPRLPVATTKVTEPETVTLSPFQVTSDDDSGYRATSTLAGTRLRTDLRDVAASVSVVTKDFMNDIGATDLGTLFNYTLGTEATGVSGNLSGGEVQAAFIDYDQVMRDPGPRTRIRGLSSADATRDYFLSDVPLDSYITERIDINRGANAMLFGLGSPAGVVNNGVIKARTNRTATEVQAQAGRFGSHRETLDHNQVLLKDTLALRLATLYGDRKYQQEFTFSRDKRAFLTVTYRPFNHTTIRANSEIARRDENRPWSRPPADNFTYWWAYGKPSFDPTTATGRLLGTPANASLAGINANGAMNTTLLSLGLGQTFNAGGLGVFYENPNSGTPGITGLPPGVVAMESTNERLLPNSTATGGFAQLRQGQIYQRAANGGTASPLSNFWRDYQITDPGIFDFYNHTLDGGNKHEWAEWRTHNITIEHTFLDGRAGIELVFDKQDLDSGYFQPVAGRDYTINIDINTKLQNGLPNPNFGRPFAEGVGFTGSSGSNREAFRATAFGDFDPKKYWKNKFVRFLGRHVVTVNYTDQMRRNYDSFAGRPALTGLDYFDSEVATVPSVTNSSSNGRRTLARVVYMGPSLVNATSARDAQLQSATANQFSSQLASVNALYYQSPAAATPTPPPFQYRTFGVIQNRGELITETTAFTPSRARQHFESGAAVLQSKWLDDVLVSTLGWRRDAFETFSSGPAVVDPVSGISATSAELLVPQRTLKGAQSTFSYGFVLHSPRFLRDRLPLGMDVSATYNQSQNFRPNTQRYTVLGEPIDAETGITREYGALLSFLGGKFELRAAKYESSAALATNANFRAVLAMLSSLPDGVIEANSLGLNNDQPAGLAAWQAWQQTPLAQRFMQNFGYVFTPGPNGSVSVATDPRTDIVVGTSSVVSRGYEFEAVINPTNRWRIAFNAARQEAVRSHTAPDLVAFFAAVNPVWLGTAGNIRHSLSSNETLAAYATSIYASVQKEILLDGSASPELRRWRWNTVTRYRFGDEGLLKGWSIGGAVRWQDKVSIGYPVIVDALTGPRYDVTRPFYGPTEINVDGFLGYRRPLFRRKIDWSVQLNVRNIGEGNKLIPISAQPDGSIAGYRIAEPMIWTLTNTFKF